MDEKEKAEIKSDRSSRDGSRSQVIAWKDERGTYHVSHVVTDKDGCVTHQDEKYDRGDYSRKDS